MGGNRPRFSNGQVGTDGKLRLLGKPERELVEEAQTTIHHTPSREIWCCSVSQPASANPPPLVIGHLGCQRGYREADGSSFAAVPEEQR